MRGVSIRYGDVAVEAKENFMPSASESKFDTLSQLQQYNLSFTNYANPCEMYQTVLDGSAEPFPSDSANVGLWSVQLSDGNGAFDKPITLELESEGQYSSQGLTLTFDTNNGIHPTRLAIKWMRVTDEGIETLSEKEYEPNNAFYFCRNFVENYNKVVITFYSINMPYNRFKLRAIDYGYGTFFHGDELRSVKVIQEVNPLSSEISINTTDFTLDSKTDMEYSFQAKQPLSTYFNGRLISTTFVKDSKRKSKQLWEVKSEDYIGLLDSIPYLGGIYTDANAADVLRDIFAVAKVPYSIDEKFEDSTITGHIPYGSCRDALMQVAFAIQAIVDTSNSDVVKVFVLDDEIKQVIHLDRIMQGQNFNETNTVTGIEVSVHTYTPREYVEDNFVMAYDANDSGTGENIFVLFSEPLYGVYPINDCELIEWGANYAIINAPSKSSRLAGCSYDHTTQTRRKNNPTVLVSELENIVAVTNATLVSPNNVSTILDKCYDWLTRVRTTNLKIAERKQVEYGDYIKYGEKKYGTFKYGEKYPDVITYDEPVNIADNITAETEYLGNVTGRIIKQSFSLNGNIVIKEAVMK